MKQLHAIIDEELRASNDADSLLFPHYDQLALRRYIRQADAHFKWPAELNWNGPHCFRRGSAADAMQSGGIEAVKARTGHRTDAMGRHYGQGIDELIDRHHEALTDPAASATRHRAERKLDRIRKAEAMLLAKKAQAKSRRAAQEVKFDARNARKPNKSKTRTAKKSKKAPR